jgi:hypothetical protein
MYIILVEVFSMVRVQIYLTNYQHQALQDLTSLTGKTQSQLIRNAIDYFLDTRSIKSKQTLTKQVLKEAAGIWANRKN